MPLYEYQCEACGHHFERIVKFSDPPVDICPACGGKVNKQISSPAFQFKGTGWYVTDYAKKSGGSDGGEKDKDKDKEKDSKTESKDAAPKEAATKSDSGSTSSDTTPAAPAKPASKD